MIRRFPLVLFAVALVVAVGSQDERPAATPAGRGDLEADIRAWNDAVNAADNHRAASFFAPDAAIVSGPNSYRFTKPADAVAFNASLPCTATIESLERDGAVIAATFVIEDPRTSVPCFGNGSRVGALFTFAQGKIAVFELAGSPEAVVSDWGESMRSGDVERAAEYFARDAMVVSDGAEQILGTSAAARTLLEQFGCSVTIIDSRPQWNRVTATLALAERSPGHCDRAGESDLGLFTVSKGRIVEWIQGAALTFRF